MIGILTTVLALPSEVVGSTSIVRNGFRYGVAVTRVPVPDGELAPPAPSPQVPEPKSTEGGNPFRLDGDSGSETEEELVRAGSPVTLPAPSLRESDDSDATRDGTPRDTTVEPPSASEVPVETEVSFSPAVMSSASDLNVEGKVPAKPQPAPKPEPKSPSTPKTSPESIVLPSTVLTGNEFQPLRRRTPRVITKPKPAVSSRKGKPVGSSNSFSAHGREFVEDPGAKSSSSKKPGKRKARSQLKPAKAAKKPKAAAKSKSKVRRGPPSHAAMSKVSYIEGREDYHCRVCARTDRESLVGKRKPRLVSKKNWDLIHEWQGKPKATRGKKPRAYAFCVDCDKLHRSVANEGCFKGM